MIYIQRVMMRCQADKSVGEETEASLCTFAAKATFRPFYWLVCCAVGLGASYHGKATSYQARARGTTLPKSYDKLAR